MQKPSAKMIWIFGSAIAILLTLFAVGIFIAANLKINVKLSAKPKKRDGKSIVLFDTKEPEDPAFAPATDPNFTPAQLEGRYEMIHRRFGRYMGISKIPDLDETLELHQDGKHLTGTLTVVRLRDVKPGISPTNWKPETVEGTFISPTAIEFKTPPAHNPPLRWQSYIGKVSESKDGTLKITGKVKIIQPDPKKVDEFGKPKTDGSIVGEWEATKISN